MGTEIEHKFLVDRTRLPKRLPKGKEIEQGFLSSQPVVRVRLIRDGRKRSGYLTIKGKGLRERAEYEYPIPPKDAADLLKLCGSRVIHKIRRVIGRIELDEFKGRHTGLWLAEIELPSRSAKLPLLPAWIGKDVTADRKYANVNLAQHR